MEGFCLFSVGVWAGRETCYYYPSMGIRVSRKIKVDFREFKERKRKRRRWKRVAWKWAFRIFNNIFIKGCDHSEWVCAINNCWRGLKEKASNLTFCFSGLCLVWIVIFHFISKTSSSFLCFEFTFLKLLNFICQNQNLYMQKFSPYCTWNSDTELYVWRFRKGTPIISCIPYLNPWIYHKSNFLIYLLQLLVGSGGTNNTK